MLENANLYEKDLDSSSTRSWGTTTVIGGTTYATSLFWQPLQNKDDPYTEIEESAGSVLEGADLFTIKPGKAIQYGVCASTDGYRKGMFSLAVAIATMLSDRTSFVGVFKVDNGWWYCCVRNDIILSDGDMLFLKEEDAKEQFMSMMTVPDWGRKYAPAEWGIEDTKEGNLEEMVVNTVRAKLKKIKALRGFKLYAVIAVSAVVGFWVLSSFVLDVLLAPKKRPVMIAPVVPKMMKQEVAPPKPIVHPWDTIKNPTEIMQHCYSDIMDLVRIMPPGWNIGGLNCTDSSVTVSWSREIGRISWINQALNQSGIKFAARSISTDGNTLVANTVFEPSIIKSVPQYGDIELRNIINDLFQSLSLQISLSPNTITIEEPSEDPNVPPRTRVYNLLNFSFSSEQNPLTWIDLLTKFSGLTINNIRYDIGNGILTGTWYYEGAIYVL